MINQKKVVLMTETAMYEHTKHVSERHRVYFEKKGRRLIALRSIPVGIILGVLVVFFVCLGAYDEVRVMYSFFGPALFSVLAALIAGVTAYLYVFFAVALLEKKYEDIAGSYMKYRLNKKQLSEMDDEE